MSSEKRSALSDHISLLLLDPDTVFTEDPGPAVDWGQLPAVIDESP